MNWRLIDNCRELDDVLSRHAGCEAVMVDTEFMRTNTFYPQVALLQLCFEGGQDATAWLVDPLQLEDLGSLLDLFEDQRVLKVLHSPSEDLEVFRRWLGLVPAPLFDTQRAAALLDRGFGLGYRALVHEICDVDLPKGETRSNWLARPLTESQCEYAAQDVTWLYPVWRELHAACEAQGKLAWLLADAQDMVSAQELDPALAYLRLKGAGKLDRCALGVLQALCRWREETARERDKPRNWIVDDKTCLQLAQEQPESLARLKATVDLPRPVLRRHGEDIVAAIEAGRDLADSDLPPALPRPLDARQRDLLKALKGRARVLAEALGAAPEILLQAKDYELLVREAHGQPVEEPAHWGGWRADTVVAPLRAWLDERVQGNG